jgi:hypothetical protein
MWQTVQQDPQNAAVVERNLPVVRAKAAEYRQGLLAGRAEKKCALADSFWYMVYVQRCVYAAAMHRAGGRRVCGTLLRCNLSVFAPPMMSQYQGVRRFVTLLCRYDYFAKPRELLEEYLRNNEPDDAVRTLPDTARASIGCLYHRIR